MEKWKFKKPDFRNSELPFEIESLRWNVVRARLSTTPSDKNLPKEKDECEYSIHIQICDWLSQQTRKPSLKIQMFKLVEL